MIKAVLFDMDGVLVSSFEAFYHATNGMLAKYGKKAVSRREFLRHYWGTYIMDDLKKMTGRKGTRRAYNEFFRLFYGMGKHVRAYPDARPVLRKLGKAYKLAIITNTPAGPARFILRAAGLGGMFDAIATGDIVRHPKPAPDIVLLACRRLRVRPDEAVVVGDMTHDVRSGRSAGALTVGVRRGIGADRYSSLKGLPRLLGNI